MVLRIGLIGCGTIGTEIATAIDDDRIPRTELTGVYNRNKQKAKNLSASLDDTPTVVDSVSNLTTTTNLVIEAASQGAVREHARDILDSGTALMVLSAGALAEEELRSAVFAKAKGESSRLYIPSGAIAGLDAIKAATNAEKMESVTLQTRKPPSGLANAPYVTENDIDLSSLIEPVTIFEGTATEAATAFPSNINVAMALSLSGIGPEKTTVTIIADPEESNNVHQIEAVGSAGRIETKVENVPSPTNPKTSYLAALSAIEKLKGITATTSIGT